MTQLTRDIKEAVEEQDEETATKLREEFNLLAAEAQKEKKARGRNQKRRIGTLGPAEKAMQALRVNFERLKGRLRKAGMPLLADHLEEALIDNNGKWVYVLPPDMPAWEVTPPSDIFPKNLQ
jgi:hypothetical protein